MRNAMPITFAVLCGVLCHAACAVENTPEYRAKLAEEKKYPDAFAAFKEASEKDPKNATLLFNAGMLASLAGKPKEGVELLTKYKKLKPDDLRARAKLIQALSAAELPKERDAERAELIKFHKDSTDEKVKKTNYFIREQFKVGEQQIMVFEYFELKGERAILWSFDLVDPNSKHIKDRISLGSYESTNAISRELNELKPGQRMYHLDYYKNDEAEHETHGMYIDEPKYDEIKATVKEILSGKRRPMSSSKQGKE